MVDEHGDSVVERFRRSMVPDYEKWHEGIGYDLDAIRAANPAKRTASLVAAIGDAEASADCRRRLRSSRNSIRPR